MLPSERMYDQTIPRSINTIRQQNVNIRDYTEYSSQMQKLSVQAQFYGKLGLRLPPRMTKHEILTKIKFRENKSRQQLLKLFNEEYIQYQEELKNRKPTEDQIMLNMQEKVQQYQQSKNEAKKIFNEQKYNQQFEENCDDLRLQKQKMNDKILKIVWNKQLVDAQQRKELEKQISRKLDQLMINDYQKYLQEQAQEHELQKQRIKQNKAALDNYLSIKEQLQAEIAAKQAQELLEAKMAAQIAKEFRDLESNVRYQESLFTQKELEVQIRLSELKKERGREREVFDYKRELKAIEEDLLAQKQKQLEDKMLQFESQTLYCELIKKRKQQLVEETKLMDKVFIRLQAEREERQFQSESELKIKRRALDDTCRQYNYQNAYVSNTDNLELERVKKLELQKAISDLQIYEEQKLEEMQKEIINQKVLRDFYENDIKEKKEEEKKRRNDEIRAEHEINAQEKHKQIKVQNKMEEIYQRMREIDELGVYESTERVMPKRQWYNE
ncbi:Conserved_hypothetical protein [Hexamita inflata]|uniref:Trichohyalin-plectin-homology domain-containing protein n=1 Tax=Hexamita inflata TaxID=28002 RepID=A0AA86NZK1_9EUKA|nr:Conserved hypothetical protein [Hexamita inflata]